MAVHNYFKILFLPKWYPHRNDNFNGIFVESLTKAMAQHCKCAVLFVVADPKLMSNYEIVVTENSQLLEVRVYYKSAGIPNNIISKTIQLYRYLYASYLGLKKIKASFGKPNLIHVNVLTRPGIIALLLKKINAIPYIITEHWSGYLPADGSYKGFVKKGFTKIVARNASAITTVSKTLEHAMHSHGLQNKYSCIPNVIDFNGCNPAQIKGEAIMVGNLEDREKNISPVIQAFAKLRTELPDIRLKIIGNGIDKEVLQELVRSLQLDNAVTFCGALPHDEVMEHISKASFIIVNSHFETFSIVAAEAIACGTPVLASRCGGPEEFITEEFGILFPLNDADALEDGIRWMFANSNSFNSEKMHQFALKNFSAQAICAQYIDLYAPLISQWEAGNTREKLHIPSTWKVLDVGSGDHPNERADVLLEREIEATEHRSGAVAVIPEGKKLVLGDATQMPFEDKSFDFVIASHIAEHIDEPEKFCNELQRVAKAGYLETPDAFSEFIFNEPFHKWIVSNKAGVLTFTEKTKQKVFSEWFYRLYYLNENRTSHKPMYSNNIFVLTFVHAVRKCWKYLPRTYTRFHWQNNFEFKVIRKSQHD